MLGDYRHEHLFTLKQSLEAYRSYQKMIDACDREIRKQMEDFQPPNTPTPPISEAEAATKKQSSDGILRSELQRAWGVDLTKIPGFPTGIAQTLFGEIGPDFTKFRSASAFASWMGLCPDNDISGERCFLSPRARSSAMPRWLCAWRPNPCITAKARWAIFYRRMRAKLGAPKAITAAAHKLARIIFHLISTRQEFDDSKFAAD